MYSKSLIAKETQNKTSKILLLFLGLVRSLYRQVHVRVVRYTDTVVTEVLVSYM